MGTSTQGTRDARLIQSRDGRLEPPADAILSALEGAEHLLFAVLDEQLRYVRVSSTVTGLNRRTAEEHVGRHIRDVLGQDAPDVVRVVEDTLATGVPHLGVMVGRDRAQILVDVLPVRVGAKLRGLVVLGYASAAQPLTEVVARVRFEELLVGLSARVGQAVSSSVEEAIATTLEAVARAQDIDRVTAWESGRGDEHRCIFQWSRSPEAGDVGSILSTEDFPWSASHLTDGGWVVQRRDELPPDAARERQAMERAGVSSVAVLPMRVGGEGIGAISFARVGGEQAWAPVTLSRLGLVATLVANALHRRRLEHAAVELARFEGLVANVSAALVRVRPGELDAALAAALTAIGLCVEADRTFLYEWDPARGEMTLRAAWSAEGEPPVNEETKRLDFGAFRWIEGLHTSRTPVIAERVSDLPPEAGAERGVLERAGVRSLLLLPLHIGDQRIGSLGIDTRRRERSWPPELVARAQILGEVLASAMARDAAARASQAAAEELDRLRTRIEQERDYLRDEIRVGHHVDEIVAVSEPMRAALRAVDAVATTNATVLVVGETGVGKEMVARALHARSRRAAAPLVRIDCASMPREMFEREFFGYAAGAFPGASTDRAGRFELADRGTILLDEVSEIPLELQAKLLRFLTDGEVERLGEHRTRKLDVRVVATTHHDLTDAVARGRFRSDLFFRLQGFPIVVPPLRERRDDVAPLARSFLARATRELGREGLTLDAESERLLLRYDWPGNARELRHVIERSLILSPEPPLRVATALAPHALREREREAPDTTRDRIHTDAELRAIERANLMMALERCDYRVSGRGGAAELLEMSPSTLRDRMRSFGIERADRSRR